MIRQARANLPICSIFIHGLHMTTSRTSSNDQYCATTNATYSMRTQVVVSKLSLRRSQRNFQPEPSPLCAYQVGSLTIVPHPRRLISCRIFVGSACTYKRGISRFSRLSTRLPYAHALHTETFFLSLNDISELITRNSCAPITIAIVSDVYWLRISLGKVMRLMITPYFGRGCRNTL